jgi:putative exosortase-associated protein (TIGR04073 family)
VIVLILIFSAAAYAETTMKTQNAATKLLRGAVNLLCGWLEVPKQIFMTTADKNLYMGLTYGFVIGIYDAFARTGLGLFETVTCPLPPYNKVFIEPEYIFEDWE